MPAVFFSILTALAGSENLLSTTAILNYLNLALQAVGLVSKSDAALTAIHDQLKQMIAEKRDPTDAEFASLTARSDLAHARIQGA